jgi:hypothetical protein
VLQKICESALQYRDDPRGLFVDYRQLPEAMWGGVARHFGLDLLEDDVARMRDALRFHAKSPGVPFAADSAGKQAEAEELPVQPELNRLYAHMSATRRG